MDEAATTAPDRSSAPAEVSGADDRFLEHCGILDEAMVCRLLRNDMDLSNVDRLEIIFSPTVEEVGDLRCLTNLLDLSLIKCGLQRTPFLSLHVGRTLRRLCLASQGLTTMCGLGSLPHLRDLFLQENLITRIEGLDGMRSLRRLWLYNNRISVIDGLEHTGDLRHLYLQQNSISSLVSAESHPAGAAPTGLLAAVNLQCLNISGNPVSEINELWPLVELPALRELCLSDGNFPPCPIARHKNFRDWVILNLEKITHLDGHEISIQQRDAKVDGHFRDILNFNDRVEQIKRESDLRMSQVDLRRESNRSKATALCDRLSNRLKDLERIVRDRRQRAIDKHNLFITRRAEALDVLKQRLAQLRGEYRNIIEAVLKATARGSDDLDEYLGSLQCRINCKRLVADMCAGIPVDSLGERFLYECPPRSPEYEYARMHFEGGSDEAMGEGRKLSLRVMDVYKVEDLLANKAFDAVLTEQPSCDGGGDALLVRFISCDENNETFAREILQKGIFANGADGVICVCENPVLALRTDLNGLEGTGGIMFLCHVLPLKGGTPAMTHALVSHVRIDYLVTFTASKRVGAHWSKASAAIRATTSVSMGSRSGQALCLLPWSDFLMHPSIGVGFDDAEDPLIKNLNSLERRADEEFRLFEMCSYNELNPEIAKKVRSMDADQRQLALKLHDTKAKIASERQEQERLLRELREFGLSPKLRSLSNPPNKPGSRGGVVAPGQAMAARAQSRGGGSVIPHRGGVDGMIPSIPDAGKANTGKASSKIRPPGQEFSFAPSAYT